MGSNLSGNYGGRPTVEGCRVLDIGRLRHQEVIRPNCRTTGHYAWTDADTGEQKASICFDAKLGDDHGSLRLIYKSRAVWTDETHALDYTISLMTTAQPFGGYRWWFLCPRTGMRVAKLYLPHGAFQFASREAYRLGYRCQREAPNDRALNRAFRLRRKLGADGGIGDVVFKPKGMHSVTFNRKMAKVQVAEAICDAHLALSLRRLQKQCRL